MTCHFDDTVPPAYPSRVAGKRHHSFIQKSDAEEIHQAKKRDRQKIEDDKKQSLFQEELCLHRACEMEFAGASDLRSTTWGVLLVDDGTTSGILVSYQRVMGNQTYLYLYRSLMHM